MPEFPLAHTVGHREYLASATEDAHGNPIATWAPPVTRRVYGWGAPTTSEPKLAGYTREVVEIELLVPPGYSSSHRDRVILDFDEESWTEDAGIPEHEVIGGPEMYDHNPFGWNPGGVVNLRKVSV
mgnify:CR=1 FL=1